MSDIPTHVRQAHLFVNDSHHLEDHNPALAGESIWGATVQALQAGSHGRITKPHITTLADLQTALDRLPYAPSTQEQMRQTLKASARALHHAFYHPDAVKPQHPQDMAAARLLIRELLDQLPRSSHDNQGPDKPN